MNPEIIYFLKTNVAIILFYAFYRLFFYKDTFFHWRRTVLLCFLGISLLYPLLNIQEWIKNNEPMVAMVDLYATTVLPEFIVQPTSSIFDNWQELLIQGISIIYWIGVSLLGIRLLVQLASIIRLHILCPKTEIQGISIHLSKKGTNPFSFFHWIFIHPESHTESEINEIITHEETHARQYHSVDVLISEIMCIFCWFNPFIWLMKREVRSNLEYMADSRVLEKGHDSKLYQYHLLGLAHHKAAAQISNSFNVLPLKNRIKMMNKQRTSKIGRTKYLMFLPLAIMLMIISNIEIVARNAQNLTKEIVSQAILSPSVQPEITTLPDLAVNTEIPQNKKEKKVTSKESDDNDPVLQFADQMPQFPGGQQALMDYLRTNIRYPVEAHATQTSGRVLVSFVVKKDGSITDSKIAKSVSPSFDQEAMRVVASMPKWKPGEKDGKAVNVQFILPIVFQLTMDALPIPEEIKETELSEVVVVSYGIEKSTTESEEVFSMVDQMPQFPGGVQGLMQYLAKSIKYPAISQKNKEQGKVILQMIIGTDGCLSDIKVVQSVSPLLDTEAIRVISSMPKWTPGKQNGKAAAVKYTIPVNFRLK